MKNIILALMLAAFANTAKAEGSDVDTQKLVPADQLSREMSDELNKLSNEEYRQSFTFDDLNTDGTDAQVQNFWPPPPGRPMPPPGRGGPNPGPGYPPRHPGPGYPPRHPGPGYPPPHHPPPHYPPPHYPPPSYPPPSYPPSASVTCYAQDAYNRYYSAYGYSPYAVQDRAIQECNYYSVGCRPAGCYRN